MTLVQRFLLSAMALGPLVAGRPAGRQLSVRSDIIIYDSSVSEAMRAPDVLVWVDDGGKPVGTATEEVVLLPTRLFLTDPSAESTATTTITVLSTQTLVVSVTGTSAADAKGSTSPVPQGPVSLGSSDGAAKRPAGASSGVTAPAGGASPLVVLSPGRPEGGGSRWNSSDDGARPPSSERFGISYAAYRADHRCKSKQDIENDVQRFVGTYSLVRIYGTDCGQVPMVYSAAKAHGLKVFLGISDVPSVKDETNKIIAGVKGDWGMVHTVSVGNELVNNGRVKVQDILDAVKTARSMLRDAGYEGPVVTVDTAPAVVAHPELCDQSDYCAFNAHAFFDSTVSAGESGQWLRDTVNRVKGALSAPGRVVVAETGWPTKGDTNGRAVPGLECQRSALDSIRREFAAGPGDVILFSAFDDLWKQNDSATFNAEPYWGIDGAVASSDG